MFKSFSNPDRCYVRDRGEPIRQANQGVFSILPADQGNDTGEPGYGGADSSIMKTVRVVTSVDYYLER